MNIPVVQVWTGQYQTGKSEYNQIIEHIFTEKSLQMADRRDKQTIVVDQKMSLRQLQELAINSNIVVYSYTTRNINKYLC